MGAEGGRPTEAGGQHCETLLCMKERYVVGPRLAASIGEPTVLAVRNICCTAQAHCSQLIVTDKTAANLRIHIHC